MYMGMQHINVMPKMIEAIKFLKRRKPGIISANTKKYAINIPIHHVLSTPVHSISSDVERSKTLCLEMVTLYIDIFILL